MAFHTLVYCSVRVGMHLLKMQVEHHLLSLQQCIFRQLRKLKMYHVSDS